MACCCVLAAGPKDSEPDRGLRSQALGYLTDDLAFWRGIWQADPTKNRSLINQRMAHWLKDTDLALTRDFAKLPEAARPLWQKLWDDVRKLHEQTGKR
jgi:hypothetical protein